MQLLHIGENTALAVEDVVAIVSRETAMRSRDTRRAIDGAIGRERLHSASDAGEKAYILLEREGELSVWSSPLAAATLAARANEAPWSGEENRLRRK